MMETKLVLLGTGTPNACPDASGPSSAVVVGDVLEDLTGDVLLQLALRPLAVEQEAAVRLELVDNVVFRQVRLVVAGDEVGAADVVGGADRLLAEAQMALRDAEGLLRVVLEVRLTVHVGRVADDLDGVLVRADRAVGAEAPELAHQEK